MENSLSYVIFSWFLTITAHQRISFLVGTKLVKNFVKVSFFFPVSMDKIQKNQISELCKKESYNHISNIIIGFLINMI